MGKARSNNTITRAGSSHRIAHWFRHHQYAVTNAGKALIQSRWTVAINTVILGLSLALPLGLLSVTNHLAYFADTFYTANKIFIELEKQENQSLIENFITLLEQDVRVDELSFLSREDLLKRVIRELNLEEDPQISEINPFSDLVEVGLTRKIDTELSIASLVEELESNALVSRVDIAGSFIVSDQFESKKLFERFALILSSIVLVSVLLVSVYMVRNQILRQALEIEVTRYCGAEDAFIRRPFLYWGAAQGFLGGIFAAVIVYLCTAILRSGGSRVSELTPPHEPFGLIFLPEFALTLGVATLLGFIGAWIASSFQATLRTGALTVAKITITS